jgi:hypothetical protein
MPKFPVDAPKAKVLAALSALGLQMIRERDWDAAELFACCCHRIPRCG